MNRIKLTIIGTLVLGAIIGVLLFNKAQMTANSQNNIISSYPVSVVPVSSRTLSETLSLVGTINASNDVAIVSETQGRVTMIRAQVGDYKTAGSTLVQIDDELKKAEFEKAEVNYERARKDMERFKSLREEHAATEWQKENAWQAFKIAEAQYIKARREYRDTKITTPISGTVVGRPVDLGTMVQPGMVVANVVDISRLKVKLNVAERDAFKLKTGDPVEVSTDVYPGVRFTGKIQSVSSKADESHTYPVEIGLPNNKQHPLKAGMFGRVAFVSLGNNLVLFIPREALVGSLKEPQVFVVQNNVAKRRSLVVGQEVGTNLVVVQGLKEGDTVVVNGQNNLKDNVAVTVVR